MRSVRPPPPTVALQPQQPRPLAAASMAGGRQLMDALKLTLLCVSATTLARAGPVDLPANFVGYGWEMDSFLGVADAGCAAAGAPDCVGHLSDPVLRTALRHLSPGVLRLGGITADWVQYQLEPPPPAPIGQLGGYWPVRERNLTAAKISVSISDLVIPNAQMLHTPH